MAARLRSSISLFSCRRWSCQYPNSAATLPGTSSSGCHRRLQ